MTTKHLHEQCAISNALNCFVLQSAWTTDDDKLGWAPKSRLYSVDVDAIHGVPAQPPSKQHSGRKRPRGRPRKPEPSPTAQKQTGRRSANTPSPELASPSGHLSRGSNADHPLKEQGEDEMLADGSNAGGPAGGNGETDGDHPSREGGGGGFSRSGRRLKGGSRGYDEFIHYDEESESSEEDDNTDEDAMHAQDEDDQDADDNADGGGGMNLPHVNKVMHVKSKFSQ